MTYTATEVKKDTINVIYVSVEEACILIVVLRNSSEYIDYDLKRVIVT